MPLICTFNLAFISVTITHNIVLTKVIAQFWEGGNIPTTVWLEEKQTDSG